MWLLKEELLMVLWDVERRLLFFEINGEFLFVFVILYLGILLDVYKLKVKKEFV